MGSDDLPEGWIRAAISDVADLRWGDTKTTKASYVESGYCAYSASGRDGFLPRFDFDRTGVVLSAIGADCGRTWLVTGKWSCIKNTIRFWSTDPQTSTDYLYWATRNPKFWPRRGSAQPFISQTDARNALVALPPLSTQLGIVDLLGSLQTRIDNLRATNTTLEAVAQALFKSWFVDFDPVHAKAEGHDPEAIDAATAALFPSEFEKSELGPIPKGWRIQKLGDVCCLTWGNTSMTKKSYVEDGFKAFSAAGQDGLVEVAERSGIGSVISAIGTVGVIHLAFGQWTAIKNTLTAQCENDADSAWLHSLLNTVRFPARGSTQQFISQTDARGVKVIAPPPDIRQEYGAICVALISRMEAVQNQIRSLTQLLDTVLPRLISGKLRLPEATESSETPLA